MQGLIYILESNELIPHLFRTEYRKITAVLVKLFGIAHIEIAEDIASDTFLQASENWGLKGLPENPTAWLYSVAKNKAKNYFRHDAVFNNKIAAQLKQSTPAITEMEIDLSPENIRDSQLQMIFAVCHPSISIESQIGLSLRILCGFGLDEIASAFLVNRETINKRLTRAREKLRTEKVQIEFPPAQEINSRLETVLTTLYLLFNEGYYSAGQDMVLRKDLCLEAMRLTHLLVENEFTSKPAVNALLSLMCFQASRFEARIDNNGEAVLYDDQDATLWNKELMDKGEYFLNRSARDQGLTKYHLEAAIAYFHTIKEDSLEKWEQVLQLYNQLLLIEYSPIAALNRTYALSKANSTEEAIAEAEKLNLSGNHLYHSLLGNLYANIDKEKAIFHLQQALALAKSAADKKILQNKIEACGPPVTN